MLRFTFSGWLLVLDCVTTRVTVFNNAERRRIQLGVWPSRAGGVPYAQRRRMMDWDGSRKSCSSRASRPSRFAARRRTMRYARSSRPHTRSMRKRCGPRQRSGCGTPGSNRRSARGLALRAPTPSPSSRPRSYHPPSPTTLPAPTLPPQDSHSPNPLHTPYPVPPDRLPSKLGRASSSMSSRWRLRA